MKRVLLSGIAALVVAGCSGANAPAPQAEDAALQNYATTARQVMLGLTIPAMDVLWGVPNNPPANDGDWERVAANAVMVAESGNLLLTGPRNPHMDDWTANVQEMIKYALQAADAAQRHDLDGVSDAGDLIYDSCDSCHNVYMPLKAAEIAEAAAAQAGD